jgi:hypothetical protein
MPFKVKDLMIDVTSKAALTPAVQCHPTVIFCHFGCTVLVSCHFACSFQGPSLCHFGSQTITFTITCPGSLVTDTTPIIQATPQLEGPQVANLKDQLKQALDAAERQQAAIDQNLQPQSVADVEMLEGKLGEALAELKARKAQLQQKK